MFSQMPPSSSSKPHPIFPTSTHNDPPKDNPWPSSPDFNMTAAKRQDPHPIYTQHTPKPQRKILLYGQEKARFLFPLVRDRDVGIEGAYQNIVIESCNDDDRETTSTQLQRGMGQTLEDLYEVLSKKNSKSTSYYTQGSD